MDLVLGQRQGARGRQRLHRSLPLGQRDGRHRFGRAHLHALAADRGVPGCIGMIDVEEGPVDRGHGALAVLAGAHHVRQRGTAGDRAAVGDIDRQRRLVQVRGQHAAFVPAAFLEPRERGQVQAGSDPVVLQFTQHTAVGQLFIGDFGRGRRCLPGLQRQQRGGEQRERRHQREQPSGRPPGWDGREAGAAGARVWGRGSRLGHGGGRAMGQVRHHGFQLAVGQTTASNLCEMSNKGKSRR